MILAFIGDRLFAGQSLRPFVIDWQSSDRPPLQAGVYLLMLPWIEMLGLPMGLGYQCVGTILQLFWRPAAWLLCRALSLPRLTTALVVCVVGSTGFVLINSVFVWPKLLAAAYAVSSGVLLLAPPGIRREAADCLSQRHTPPSPSCHMGVCLPLAGLIRFPVLAAPVIIWHGMYFGTTWLTSFDSAPINHVAAIPIFAGLALAAITIAWARRVDLALDNTSAR